MGSEHYCLRWSNHQSNLLGVFSQLLQDESLVDVTLACSEGASIRAHKVVLSACSSYFQSLFLDHPEKHPIVILKDVRLSELQTLVEFMYKGEVNVQYCQLSALLKTAESLKVKGLAEMTNQNTALREPEREPDRLRSSHSQQSSTAKSSSGVSIAAPTSSAATAASSSSSICDPQCSMETSSPNLIGSGSATGSTICASSLSQQQQTQISTNSSSVLASISTTNSNFNLAVKRENDRCSPSPPKRLHSSAPSSSPLPLDLYQRRCPSNRSDRHRRLDEEHDLSTSSMGGGGAGNTSIGGGCGGSSGSGGVGGVSGRLSRTPTTINDEQLSPGSCGLLGDKEREKERDRDKHNNSTDDDDDGGPNSIGINMTINSSSSNNGIQSSSGRDSISNRISSGGNDGGISHTSSSQTVVVPPLNTSNTPTSSFHTSDLRPSSRSGGSGTINVNITHTATSSGISSPIISTEPVAGPSGLGPVQSVPLSLKKEIDWERSDDKSGDTIDYRHSHDSETSESPHGALGGIGTTSTTITASSGNGGGGGGGSSSSLEQNNPIYPCMYCCATFPHQSKLTRHILSHSLETLKYRETAHLLHSGHIANLLPHDLPPLPQHFTHRHGTGLVDPMDTTDSTGHSQLDMELHAAAYAAAAAAQTLSGNVNLAGVNSADILMGTSPSSLLAVAAASSQSGLSGNQSGCSMVGINNSNSNNSCLTGNTITGNTNSSSAAVAAAVAAATASSSSISATSDPNNVVLCKFCGKSFPDVASLITHLPVHTGDRPFKCEFCGKAFKLRHHMKDHCRVHTGERPFRCSMCGKTFSRSTILKAHEKTHFPKYVRKFLSTSPVDTKDELPQ